MGITISAIAGAATTSAVVGTVVAGVTISALGAAIIGGIVATVVGGALISKPSQQSFNAQAQNILLNNQSNNAPIPVIYGTRRTGGTLVWLKTHGNVVKSEKMRYRTSEPYLAGETVINVGSFGGDYEYFDQPKTGDIIVLKSIDYLIIDQSFNFNTNTHDLTIDPPLVLDLEVEYILFIKPEPEPIDSSYLTAFLVVSEGEIESYESVWLDGVLSTKSKFENKFWLNERYGTDDQLGFESLERVSTIYTKDTHRLSGTAYLWLNMFFHTSNNVFPNGIPLINALVKGVKIFDPRNSLIAWSDNPILCVRDYLTNARYGRGIDPLLIDDTSFISAANYCDEEIAYNGTDLIKRYTCNGVVETQTNSLDIIKQLLSACRGFLIFSGGFYKVIIDKPEMAVFTFSEDNIIGGWKIKLGDKNSKFNQIRGNFFNLDKDYQSDIAIADSPDFRVLDGGLLERMIDLPFTSDIVRAKAISTLNLQQSRYPIVCEFTSTIEALRVEVGDVVYINHETPGWDSHNAGLGKKFRIMRITLQNNDEVRIMANEYADAVYDLADIDEITPTPTDDPNDLSICLPPTNLIERQVISNETRLYISWDASLHNFVDFYEINFRYENETQWSGDFITRGLSYNIGFGNRVITYIDIRVRAINTLSIASEWLE